ncbi:cobalamin biosynthesis protein [Stappia sp. F7233]|uniref:Cobalamin biosynthesis protein CobD n=1 Tax=Stappia albiluteola TaxID=2758565 RepID=A0A839ABX4_9HYPH|nr:adenosylcobinamide-phosphate synthase CbiB [Stappia albiluteola]MBA5776452.1 cobalamin biosynthesis protein [Stappia albiluteola]
MLFFADAAFLLLFALLVDAAFGDPDFLWRRLPHPVTLFGKIIEIADQDFNTPDLPAGTRKLYGAIFLAALVFGAFLLGLLIEAIARVLPFGEILTVLVAAVFLAQRSLYDHVARVRDGLLREGLAGGRKAVAMIVGRDPARLDEAGVSRAAIESCAENFSDGVVAPAFWFLVFGLPGLLAYKAVNTADSMIGHRTERHEAFGWASARFDDLVNLPASRLAGAFLAIAAPLAGGSVATAFRTIGADAGRHRSPNAGWPEAAMAGGLGLALAGPRAYPGYVVEDPFLNEAGRRDANAGDITRSLRLLGGACTLQAVLVAIFALLF